MKKFAAVLFLSMFVTLVDAQVLSGGGNGTPTIYGPNKPAMLHKTLTTEQFQLAIVKKLINNAGQPITSGRALLHRMGDEAAVAVMKNIGSVATLNEQQGLTILEIVQTAFESPQSVANAQDRQPNASQFLLQALDGTEYASVKARVSEVRAKVLAVAPKP